MLDSLAVRHTLELSPQTTLTLTYTAVKVFGLWWSRQGVTTSSTGMLGIWQALAESHHSEAGIDHG